MIKKFLQRLFVKQNIPIFVILIIAGFMRLYKIEEYLIFLGDEGRDVLVAKHILEGDLTLLGPTASVGGFFLGPIYYYMMAPFLWLFNYSPVGPAVMVALFGVATVWLVYKVTKDFFGYYPALAASLLYAVSPLVILYSRSSWNPNTVPFFALLMFYVLYKAVPKRLLKLFVFAGILYGILLQLHYLTTFLAPVVALYIAFSTIYLDKKKIVFAVDILKRYLAFGVGTLLGWSPFIAFEFRHGFPNFQSITKFVFTSGETGGNEKYFVIAQDVFMRVFGRLLLAFPRVEDLELYHEKLLEIWGLGAYVLGIASVVFCVYMLIVSVRKRQDGFYRYLLLLLWLLVCIVLFGFYKKPIYDYYLGLLYPVPFILFGGLISLVIKKDVSLRKQSKLWIIIVFAAVISLSVLHYSYRQFRVPGNHQLKQVKQIADFVLSQTDGKPYNFAVISAGGNSDYAYRYFFEAENRAPVTIQFPGADPERNTITDQLLIVCESNPCHPLGYSLWEVAGFGQAEIVGEWPVSVLKVYKLKHYKP